MDKPLKLFQMKQIREAIQYSSDGGQALHIHTINAGHRLFKKYPVIGHLFDQDTKRLIYLAGRLGVNVIKIEYEGNPRQHIDLCGKPFERARDIAQALESIKGE
jgi:hypothetical protein